MTKPKNHPRVILSGRSRPAGTMPVNQSELPGRACVGGQERGVYAASTTKLEGAPKWSCRAGLHATLKRAETRAPVSPEPHRSS